MNHSGNPDEASDDVRTVAEMEINQAIWEWSKQSIPCLNCGRPVQVADFWGDLCELCTPAVELCPGSGQLVDVADQSERCPVPHCTMLVNRATCPDGVVRAHPRRELIAQRLAASLRTSCRPRGGA